MDRTEATRLAAKLAASFPGSVIGESTIVVWAEELLGLDMFQGAEVIEHLQKRKRPPNVADVQSAIRTIKSREIYLRDEQRSRQAQLGQVEDIRTFGEWAKTDLVPVDKVQRMIEVLGPKSYVAQEMTEGLAEREKNGAIPYPQTQIIREPCDKCGKETRYNPNSQEVYDKLTGRMTYAHIDCDKMEVRRAPEPDPPIKRPTPKGVVTIQANPESELL